MKYNCTVKRIISRVVCTQDSDGTSFVDMFSKEKNNSKES